MGKANVKTGILKWSSSIIWSENHFVSSALFLAELEEFSQSVKDRSIRIVSKCTEKTTEKMSWGSISDNTRAGVLHF